jgi:hypothetical protein
LVALDTRNHVLLEADLAWRTFVTEVRSFLGKKELVSTTNDKRLKKSGLGISGWIKGPET